MNMGKTKEPGRNQECRCCLKDIGLKELWKEYYNGDEREVYGEMVNECFAVPWEPLFGKTEHICDSCIGRLRDAVSFKKEILYSNYLLNERAKNEPQITVKQEEQSDNDNEVEPEYLSVEWMDDPDKDKSLQEIKIEQESKSVQSVKPEATPSKRGKRYTQEQFQKCIEAVQSGLMSQTKASFVFHVPRTTIGAALTRLYGSRGPTSDPKIKKEPPSTEASEALDFLVDDFHNRLFPELVNFRSDMCFLLESSNVTPIRSRAGIGYKCCFCQDEYPDPADLKIHTLQAHDLKTRLSILSRKYAASSLIKLDITFLQCTICNYQLDTLEDLIDHLIQGHGAPIHRNIKNYILPFKFHGDELRCVICSTVFHKFQVLLVHMNTHFRNYICDHCDSGFTTRTILVNHLKCHQTGVFRCDFCFKKYDTLRKKKAHVQIVHYHGNMMNKCGYCNERFSSFKKKEDHLVQAHGVPQVTVTCQVCGKTYSNRRALTNHMKRGHPKVRRHRCDVCDKKFLRLSDVKRHRVKHTDARRYDCDVCLRSYKNVSTLREHVRLHADDGSC